MLVLLITADLATSSRVSGAAARNGVSLVTAMQASSVDSAADKTPDLVTVDLSTPAVDVSSVVAQLRALPEPPAVESPYLDSEKAAAYLGIGVKQLYRQVELGKLKPLRGPRNSYRFTQTMLDDYLGN